jgi:YidC/Oxa1 family membrane protein insertase
MTVLLKIVLFYPTHRSMKSAKRMAKQMAAIKPELDRIKEKYADDRGALNQAQAQLFQKHGINPLDQLSGCLPMIPQMFIYIAFYSMLSNAVELYRAPFIGPVKDMTESFWPLALLTGALMFAQQKLSPVSPDSQQQKTMMYMVPLMFMVMTVMLPSGLTLYILTNTLLTMLQQWLINRGDRAPGPAPRSPKPPQSTKGKAAPARA